MAQRMQDGLIEETRYPAQPSGRPRAAARRDVCGRGASAWTSSTTRSAARRTSRSSPSDVFDAVLDMLSGRYPSDGFAELRPRLVWDRADGTVRARDGAGRFAITSGGTIPDRGLFAVFLPDGVRVGELDEEMVFECRRGEVIVLGASSWRIEDITRDRVVVTPAPGEHGQDAVLEGRQARPTDGARPGDRRVHARRCADTSRRRARSPASTSTVSTTARPPTSSPTSTSRPRRRARCPTIARSSSSASATRSATGGCVSSLRSAPGCMLRGRWRSRPGSSSAWARARRCCGATTAS